MTENERYVPGQIIVMFEAGVTEKQATELIETQGWQKINWLSRLNIMLVAVPKGREEECARKMEDKASVRAARLNYKAKLIQ